MSQRPDYDSLPVNDKSGRRSCWGLWDQDGVLDHLGSLNNLTANAKKRAAQNVTHGLSFQLDWAYHNIGKPAFGRTGLSQKIINYKSTTGEVAHDDEISLNTQCGSQWDGFMHYADQIAGCYYNGVKHTENIASLPDVHGIHHWCKEGIVGRGVLLDWPRWRESTGQPAISAAAGHGITVQDLLDIARHQNVNFESGDILIIRTGFVPWYESSSDQERAQVFNELSFTGVEQGEDVERWLWNTAISAVAGDAVSWERYPPPKNGSTLHQWLLPHAGMPIGELWNLEELAESCEKTQKWTFLLTSAPLNVRGGIGSPPNALAIL